MHADTSPSPQPPDSELSPLPSPSPASFRGRLQLDAFKYTAHDTQPRRNPPRATTTTTRSAPPNRSASRRPTPKTTTSTTPDRKPSRRRPATYAHLPLLPDALGPNLLVLFVGLNPGLQTARTGHAYAHPSNLFWKLLFNSGVTPQPCRAEEDRSLPARFALGLTNIVARPSRSGADLTRAEMDAGVALLHEKARACRAECVCIVGKSIWESVWRVRHGRPVGSEFRYGWQEEEENMGGVEGGWSGARVFVATSTSGLAASLSPAKKLAIWQELGSWCGRGERRGR